MWSVTVAYFEQRMLIKNMVSLLDGATIPRDDLKRLPPAHCTSLRDVTRRHVVWRLSSSEAQSFAALYCFLVHQHLSLERQDESGYTDSRSHA